MFVILFMHIVFVCFIQRIVTHLFPLSLFFFFSSKDSGTSGSAQLEISSVNLNDAGITLIQLNDSPQFSSTPNDYPDTYYCIGILHQETVIDVLSFSIYQTYICVVVLISQSFILS
jgi:hypothetical protein